MLRPTDILVHEFILFVSYFFIYFQFSVERIAMAVEKDNISRAMNTWKVPKSHGMQHTAPTIKLYGLLSSSSAVGQRTGEYMYGSLPW